MFPWVLLYGITAFLFNHPAAFPDQQQIRFGRAEVGATPLADLPNAKQLAEKVVQALAKQARTSKGSALSYRLVEPDQAAYGEDVVFARVDAPGQRHDVVVHLSDGSGRVQTRPVDEPTEKAPFPSGSLDVEGSPTGVIKEALPAVLQRFGLPPGSVSIASAPELRFQVEAEGKRWHASYNMLTGEVTGRPAEMPSPGMSLRAFLEELHLASGFPTTLQTRWFWALAVDAMFVSMLFWGLSGLLMFWQIKSVRRWGIGVLLASAVGALTLAIGMHGELAR